MGLDVPAIDLRRSRHRFTRTDLIPTSPVEVAGALATVVRESCAHHGCLPIPHVRRTRSPIAGPSMVMLYRVGVMTCPWKMWGARRHVAIDGGMSG